ncbi:ribonuclease H-like domain-containing protein [Tanacetum coccineum]|uniref:Ribonuclease H-like domain-containing protein n=1 Tax=Tanacetum coccineum TaxID=301880 RepID=A0ABQ4ZYX3_9ASTR
MTLTNLCVDVLSIIFSYACSDSLLLTQLCCDDIHDVTPRVSAFAGCDTIQGRYETDRLTTTQVDDQNWSEGNLQNSIPSTSQSTLTHINDEVHTPVLRRSDREFKPPVRLNDYVLNFNVKYGIEKYVNYYKLNSVNMCFATSLNKSIEPSYLSEAIKPIGSKWIWKIKCKASGEIKRYKARLVAKGFSQREDVYNAFLYDDLVEDVYMTFLDGYNNKDNSKFCDKFIALLVYVDDIVITGNDDVGIKEFKLFLSTTFLIKDLGILKYFLGIEIVENDLVDIPLLENTILSFEETKDDNQHMHSPLQSYIKAALRVLRYLKGSPGRGIQFYKHPDLKLKAYAGVDWAKCPKTRSSSEAEYRSMSSASCEIVWLANLLHNIGLKNLYPVDLCCDNFPAIQIATNPVFHERTKHFELDVHFVREKVLAGIIKIVNVSSDLQTSDVFIKCLGVVQHRWCCKNLGMLDVFAGEIVGKDSRRKNYSRKKKGQAHEPEKGC